MPCSPWRGRCVMLGRIAKPNPCCETHCRFRLAPIYPMWLESLGQNSIWQSCSIDSESTTRRDGYGKVHSKHPTAQMALRASCRYKRLPTWLSLCESSVDTATSFP